MRVRVLTRKHVQGAAHVIQKCMNGPWFSEVNNVDRHHWHSVHMWADLPVPACISTPFGVLSAVYFLVPSAVHLLVPTLLCISWPFDLSVLVDEAQWSARRGCRNKQKALHLTLVVVMPRISHSASLSQALCFLFPKFLKGLLQSSGTLATQVELNGSTE
jgi:hypothetical protein